MIEESDFTERECTPCKKGILPLTGDVIKISLRMLEEGWTVVEDRYLEKEYLFPDFRTALQFANQIGEVAEAECHHPDLYLSYGKLKVQLSTHKIKGLSENDFILASKCDLIPRRKCL